MYCKKQYSRKDNLTRHLKGNNSCMVSLQMESKNKEIELLKKKIEELTQQLIDKPTTITNNQTINNTTSIETHNFNITREDYFKQCTGFFINHTHIEDYKLTKLEDIIENYIGNGQLKKLTYYHVLQICNTPGEIVDGVLITNLHQGKLDVKCNNKVDTYTKNSHHFEIDTEMKKVYSMIYDYVRRCHPKQLKNLEDHVTLMNRLRLDLKKEGKSIGNDWKQKKEQLLCIKN